MAANHNLLEITQPEAERILRERGLVLIPTGSVEQHGPHLPVGTDYYAPLAIGRMVAPRVRGLLVPWAPLGVTPFHLSFAGTLSLRVKTFMRVFRDVVESLVRHGADKVVILNSELLTSRNQACISGGSKTTRRAAPRVPPPQRERRETSSRPTIPLHRLLRTPNPLLRKISTLSGHVRSSEIGTRGTPPP